MQTAMFVEHRKNFLLQQKSRQSNWQRIILLIVLGYEGAGALAGSTLLIAAPDGRYMKMPVDIMHGAFRDFLLPGIILFALGILNISAFVAVLRKKRFDWLMSALALGALAIWFWIEIAVLQGVHWLHAMWGLPVVAGFVAAIPLVPNRNEFLPKAALVCGILSSLLYVVINIIVPLNWNDYNSTAQTVSELSSVGAPTRILWTVLATPYTVLVLAFAWGVLKSAGDVPRLQLAGRLLLAYGVLDLLWPFAPMHLRETLAAGGGNFSDTMHIGLAAVTQLLYLLVLGLTASAFGKQFRIYSILTFILLLFFGVLTFLQAPGIAVNKPTPLIGVWERINIGLFLTWVIVLAAVLLRRTKQDLSIASTPNGIRIEARVKNRQTQAM